MQRGDWYRSTAASKVTGELRSEIRKRKQLNKETQTSSSNAIVVPFQYITGTYEVCIDSTEVCKSKLQAMEM